MHSPDPDFHAVHPGDGLEPCPRDDAPGLRVCLATLGAHPEAVFVRSEPDHEERLDHLALVDRRNGWAQWEGWLPLAPHHRVTRYVFVCRHPGAQRWLSQAGLHAYPPPGDLHFRHVDGYQPPRWVWDQVVYQVFPDRFRDGDPGNNVRDGEYLYAGRPVVARAWDEVPDARQGAREFFGGDLDGVRQALPNLVDLGVSTVYLNPIFVSPSSHKDDTVDYEIGLEGHGDPDCRRPFPWDPARWDQALRATVQRLARLRRSAPPLARGDVRTLRAEGDVHAFARTLVSDPRWLAADGAQP